MSHSSLQMEVPFVDLRAQHEEVGDEIDAMFHAVVQRSDFIGGELVTAFEREFAAFCGARHAVTCASGTDALKLGLMALGVQENDEVITVPMTFIATVEAITMVGAQPVFIDVDPTTYGLSACRLEEFIESECYGTDDGTVINKRSKRRVAGILPVHLYGLPVDMDPIQKLARRYNLKVLEDACQAHGARYRANGREAMVGTLGHAAAFSFYPGKNLGAMGEGGAAVTNDDHMADLMRMWRDHGQSQRYVHISPHGWNGRLDALQCALLSIKLRRLSVWNESRRRAAAWYRQRLGNQEDITLPVESPGRMHVYHLFVVRLKERDRVRDMFLANGVGVGMHYPIPLHLQKAYEHLGLKKGDFPVAEAMASTVLSLPMYPHITEEQVDYVSRVLVGALH